MQGYDVEIIIPESYPWLPPYARFSQKIWHPAINLLSGVIDRHHNPVLPEDWSPKNTLNGIVEKIRHILSSEYLEEHFSVPPKINQISSDMGDDVGETKRGGSILERRQNMGKRKPKLTRSNSSIAKSEEEETGINMSAFTQYATNKTQFRQSVKNFNLKSEETTLDLSNVTHNMLKKCQLLMARAARSIIDSNDYINNRKMSETRNERASALEKILNIGQTADVFEKKCQMTRIEKKFQLDKILAENQLDETGMTLLDRKASIIERRNTRIAELEALASGSGMFDSAEQQESVAAIRLSVSGPSGPRRRDSMIGGSKLPSLLE